MIIFILILFRRDLIFDEGTFRSFKCDKIVLTLLKIILTSADIVILINCLDNEYIAVSSKAVFRPTLKHTPFYCKSTCKL